MTAKQLKFIDDGFDLGKIPDLMPLRSRVVGLQVSATSAAGIGQARDDTAAILAGNQLASTPLVAFLPALCSFLSQCWLSFGFGVRVLGTGRNRRVARREFLDLPVQLIDLPGQLIDLPGQLIDPLKQRQDERFDSGSHLGFEFRRQRAHASIEHQKPPPRPDRSSIAMHRLVNGYTRTSVLLGREEGRRFF